MTDRPDPTHPTAAQRERQRTRQTNGRYAEMTPCYGECGKRLNLQGEWREWERRSLR